MSYKNHGFTHGFLIALNRCVATSFFTVPQGRGQGEKKSPLCEIAPRMPRNLAQEKYLAIPTFIRQGKILGL